MDGIYTYHRVSGDNMVIYRIKIADSPFSSWYQQITSIEGFVKKIGNRWFQKYQSSGIGVLSHSDCGVEERWLNINKYLPEEKFTVEYKDFESVWDFYKYIGYDHKDKSKKQLDFLITNWKD